MTENRKLEVGVRMHEHKCESCETEDIYAIVKSKVFIFLLCKDCLDEQLELEEIEMITTLEIDILPEN